MTLGKTAVFAFLVAAIAAFLTMDYFKQQRVHILEHLPAWLQDFGSSAVVKKTSTEEKLFTISELNEFDGSDESPGLYLALFGQVFDVSEGSKHYGPGGSYSFFAAKDATRAYVSGDFTEKGLTEDVSGLEHSDMLGIEEWLQFYHKTYKYLGKLIGHFYDHNGNPTMALKTAENALEKARKWNQMQKNDYQMYPRCNSKWTQVEGTTVWCSDQSGGIKRKWEGVPRLYFKPGSKTSRCACIRTSGPPGHDTKAKTNRGDLDNPNFRMYSGCTELSNVCKVPKDD